MRHVRIAEADPFPSLAASHRQSMSLASGIRPSLSRSPQVILSILVYKDEACFHKVPWPMPVHTSGRSSDRSYMTICILHLLGTFNLFQFINDGGEGVTYNFFSGLQPIPDAEQLSTASLAIPVNPVVNRPQPSLRSLDSASLNHVDSSASAAAIASATAGLPARVIRSGIYFERHSRLDMQTLCLVGCRENDFEDMCTGLSASDFFTQVAYDILLSSHLSCPYPKMHMCQEPQRVGQDHCPNFCSYIGVCSLQSSPQLEQDSHVLSLETQGDTKTPSEPQVSPGHDTMAATDRVQGAQTQAGPQMEAAPSAREVQLQHSTAVSPFEQGPLATQVRAFGQAPGLLMQAIDHFAVIGFVQSLSTR